MRHEDCERAIKFLGLTIDVARFLGEHHQQFIDRKEEEIADLRRRHDDLARWAKDTYDIDVPELGV